MWSAEKINGEGTQSAGWSCFDVDEIRYFAAYLQLSGVTLACKFDVWAKRVRLLKNAMLYFKDDASRDGRSVGKKAWTECDKSSAADYFGHQ